MKAQMRRLEERLAAERARAFRPFAGLTDTELREAWHAVREHRPLPPVATRALDDALATIPPDPRFAGWTDAQVLAELDSYREDGA